MPSPVESFAVSAALADRSLAGPVALIPRERMKRCRRFDEEADMTEPLRKRTKQCRTTDKGEDQAEAKSQRRVDFLPPIPEAPRKKRRQSIGKDAQDIAHLLPLPPFVEAWRESTGKEAQSKSHLLPLSTSFEVARKAKGRVDFLPPIPKALCIDKEAKHDRADILPPTPDAPRKKRRRSIIYEEAEQVNPLIPSVREAHSFFFAPRRKRRRSILEEEAEQMEALIPNVPQMKWCASTAAKDVLALAGLSLSNLLLFIQNGIANGISYAKVQRCLTFYNAEEQNLAEIVGDALELARKTQDRAIRIVQLERQGMLSRKRVQICWKNHEVAEELAAGHFRRTLKYIRFAQNRAERAERAEFLLELML